MNWVALIVAGLFETGFAFCLGKMKDADGLPYYLWGAGFLLCLTLSMLLLAKATQSIPIGTAYPVWTGIGAVGTVVVGILFLHEPATPRAHFLHHVAHHSRRRAENVVSSAAHTPDAARHGNHYKQKRQE